MWKGAIWTLKQTRRDNRNRVLRTGETQRQDGRYAFKYVDPLGRPHFVYSWRLVETDRVPKGKRQCVPLRDRERQIQRDLEDGINTPGGRMTVCQLYERYTRYRSNVRPATERGRDQLMRILREDELGGRRIESVRPTDAKGWAVRMQGKGYAYTTINNHKRSLKAAFYTAVQDDFIRKNPFDFGLGDVIENDTTPKVPLSAAQEESFLAFVRTDPVYAHYYDEVVILLETGLRISELCGLTRSDIDLVKRSVRVDHQLLFAKGGGYRVAKPKTQSGNRVIYMSDKVFEAFRRVLTRSGRREPIVIEGKRDFLFLNTRGMPRVSQGYASVFRGMVGKYRKGDRLPLPEVMTAHTLRHTFCTNMAMKGMNPKALQYVMGHTNIEMTLGYYAHSTSESALEEMRRVVA